MRDILKGEAGDIPAAVAVIAAAAPDILVLQGFDYDHGLAALGAFNDLLGRKGQGFPHLFALRPNTGIDTGQDVDGDGRLRGARDAQGYGAFAGQGGMAVLARWPIALKEDHSGLLWRDLPGALIATDDRATDVQRLSSVAHWVIVVTPPDQPPVTLLTYHATPPVFDGPEDRNGRRNHDETAFWLRYLDGKIGGPPPARRYVVVGDANLDPFDGEGRKGAIRALLADPRLQDPHPASETAARAAQAEGGSNSRQAGPPELDTANWNDAQGPGNLRVDYLLPSADWGVVSVGVLWAEGSGREGGGKSRHGLVWADLE